MKYLGNYLLDLCFLQYNRMADDDECNVCYEYIAVESDVVQCPSCDFITCKECCKKFLIGESSLPHCMSCKTRWGREFLSRTFDSWLENNKKGGYRYHRKKLLVDQAKAHIPEILGEIKEEKDRMKEKETGVHNLYVNLASVQQDIIETQQEINELTYHLYGEKISSWMETSKEQTKMNKLIRQVKNCRIDENRLLRDITDQLKPLFEQSSKPSKNYHFVCPCPRSDCKGLVEKETFCCAVCEKKICRICREPKSSKKKKKHVCNPETIENLKLIRQDTKPCPECAVPISKIDGCSQMWCSQCKFVYNWETGRKETGNIHNPHAIRWEREHGKLERDINDIPCGGLVEFRDIRILQYGNYPHRDKVETIYQRVSEIARHRRAPTESKYICRDYLIGKINESKWRRSSRLYP